MKFDRSFYRSFCVGSFGLLLVLACYPGDVEAKGPRRGGPSIKFGPSLKVTLPSPAPAVRVVKPARTVVRTVPAPRVVIAAKPRIVFSLPIGYQTVAFGDVTYYQHGLVYYRPLWQEDRWVYVEAAPPVYVAVASPPSGAERIVIDGQVYYRDNRANYKVAQQTPPTPTPAAPTTNTAAPAAIAPSPQVASQVQVGPISNETGSPPELIPAGGSPSRPVQVEATRRLATQTQLRAGTVVDELPSEISYFKRGQITYFQSGETCYMPIQVGGQFRYVVVEKPAE